MFSRSIHRTLPPCKPTINSCSFTKTTLEVWDRRFNRECLKEIHISLALPSYPPSNPSKLLQNIYPQLNHIIYNVASPDFHNFIIFVDFNFLLQVPDDNWVANVYWNRKFFVGRNQKFLRLNTHWNLKDLHDFQRCCLQYNEVGFC